MTTEPEPFADNWIYLHDPGTRAGRVQNYGAWSDGMVQAGTTCLGVEYFCFRGDDIWNMTDSEAVELAKQELAKIGLIDPEKVFDGVKVLVPNAYPMYDEHYEEATEIVREWLEGFENLKTFGRNGLHRYNNQDHSMWTAVLATLNLLDGSDHDVWAVNTEEEHLEEGAAVDAALAFDFERTAGQPGSLRRRSSAALSASLDDSGVDCVRFDESLRRQAKAILEAHFGSPAEQVLGCGDVGPGVSHVAGALGEIILANLSPEGDPDRISELVHTGLATGCDVDDATGDTVTLTGKEVRLDDIVDERKVPRLLAVAVNRDGTSLVDRSDKARHNGRIL